MNTIHELITQTRAQINAKITRWNDITGQINTLRSADGYQPSGAAEKALLEQREAIDSEQASLQASLAIYEADARQEAEQNKLLAQIEPVNRNQGDGSTRSVTMRDGQPQTTPAAGAQPFIRMSDGQRASVSRDQRFVEHPAAAREAASQEARDAAIIGQHGSLGQLVRAMSTTGGSAIVPTVWAGNVIDRARNLSAVLQAGAEIVPMDAKTVQIGRLTADPTAACRAEGSAITPSDPTFDNVTLTATSMNALVIGSTEWFQDASNAESLVEDAIAKAMALQLDLAALYGQITSGAGSINLPSPAPKGLLANLLANAASSFFNELLDALYTPRDYNESPNAMIWNSKAARLYAKAYDTTGQPLAWPADLASVDKYVSNQIPSYTQGTMSNVATDVFLGDWAQLLIGQRLDITLQILTERYADNGQIGIVASWRGDVGVARPRAFSVYRALKGNA